MNRTVRIQKLWTGLDHLLLLAVFVLLGIVWYSAERCVEGQGGPQPRETGAKKPVSHRPPWVVDGLRVSNGGQSRMRTIARSMAATDWDRLPPSPAMDMREDGKTYEVLFSLPVGVEKDSVRVTGSGNVMTLTMKDAETGKLYMQRVRVPCVCDRKESLQSVVSNDVLRVRITPCGG